MHTFLSPWALTLRDLLIDQSKGTIQVTGQRHGLDQHYPSTEPNTFATAGIPKLQRGQARQKIQRAPYRA